MADLSGSEALIGGGLVALIMGMLVLALVMLIVSYIYSALVLMTLAKKFNYDKPWLAWIPIANMFLLPIFAKKEWPWGFLLLIPFVNIIFFVWWSWIIFERRKYPGYLSLVFIGAVIPWIGFLFGIAYAIIWGMVAWRDN